MRKLAIALICAFSVTMLQGHPGCHQHPHPPPGPDSILLVMTDDQRWDTVRFMSTVMNELVAKGVTFENSFVSVPTCCPSRASTYSGKWGHNTGVVFNRPTDDPEGGDPYNGGIVAFDNATCIAHQMQAAGYKTAIIGKVFNSNDLFSPQVLTGWDKYATFVADGFNFFDYDMNVDGTVVHYGTAEVNYSTDVIRDMALDWLDTLTDEPFFLVWTPYAPHFDVGFYDTTPAPRHVGYSTGITFDTPSSYLEADISDKPEWLINRQPSVTPYLLDHIDDFRYQTVDALQAVDEGLGAILDKIDQMTRTSKTMVVFTSDNGYLWGEHNIGMKGSLYEESIRVPLVIRYPTARPMNNPTAEDELVVNVDLAPTFAEVAGQVGSWNGASLIPILETGTAPGWRTALLSEHWLAESTIPNILIPNLHPPIPDAAMVRTATHKLVDYQTGKDELYDLVADPYELVNVIDDPTYATVKAALETDLAALLAE